MPSTWERRRDYFKKTPLSFPSNFSSRRVSYSKKMRFLMQYTRSLQEQRGSTICYLYHFWRYPRVPLSCIKTATFLSGRLLRVQKKRGVRAWIILRRKQNEHAEIRRSRVGTLTNGAGEGAVPGYRRTSHYTSLHSYLWDCFLRSTLFRSVVLNPLFKSNQNPRPPPPKTALSDT